jgi:hypothetical protein
MGNGWVPGQELIAHAPEHVSWEYVSLLAAALEMTNAHPPPVNHEVQEAFLVHVRNLADFFNRGVGQFRDDPSTLPARGKDDIYAVDLCTCVKWDETSFDDETQLRHAINKALSPMTYSRDLRAGKSKVGTAFRGPSHAHGTVMLIRRTWDRFVPCLKPQIEVKLRYWLEKHSKDMKLAPLYSFDARYENAVRRWSHWSLNKTPDGVI